MKTIYKYQIEIADMQVIKMPAGWEIISIQNQNDILTAWAIVDPEKKDVEVCFAIYGTGHPMRNINQSHIATVQMDNGLVWHVFFVR